MSKIHHFQDKNSVWRQMSVRELEKVSRVEKMIERLGANDGAEHPYTAPCFLYILYQRGVSFYTSFARVIGLRSGWLNTHDGYFENFFNAGQHATKTGTDFQNCSTFERPLHLHRHFFSMSF